MTGKRPAGGRPKIEDPEENHSGINRPGEKCPAKNRTAGKRPAEGRQAGDRPKVKRTAENRPEKDRSAENRSAEKRPAENRPKEDRSEKKRSAENRPEEDRSAEKRLAENNSEKSEKRKPVVKASDRDRFPERQLPSNPDPVDEQDSREERLRKPVGDREFDREERPRQQNRSSPERRRAEEESRRRLEAWERDQREKILRRKEREKEKERQSAKRRKILKWTLIPVLCVLILFLIATMAVNGYMLWVDGRYVKTPEEWKEDIREKDVECIFVLGCSVNPDQSPSAALKSRLDRAAELYKMSPHKILVSGDHSEDGYYNEVKVMKQYLIDWGIPSEDIYVDHYGFSTYDSIYRAYNTFGIRRMTIVTEEFHIYRSIFLARSFGMEADGVASKEQTENNWSFREIIARDKDFLSSVFRPDPEKTGDRISLTGSGDDTNER